MRSVRAWLQQAFPIGSMKKKFFQEGRNFSIWSEKDAMLPDPAEQLKHFLSHYQLGSKKIILTVGSLLPERGQETVVRVLARLEHSLYRDTVYVVVGQGHDPYKAYFLRLIRNVRLEDRVLLITSLSRENLKKWYQVCDIYVDISHIKTNTQISQEKIAEACCYAAFWAKPVIFSSFIEWLPFGTEELVKWGVEPHNLEDVKAKLHMLLDDPILRQQYGSYVQERARCYFDSQKMVKEHIT